MPLSNRRAELTAWLEDEIMPWFSDRALPVTLAVAERWGDLAAQCRAKGQPRPIVDSLIAATAATHGLSLATRNVADYEGLGVTILNPWDAA